jgi:hypothetical protein
MLQFWRNMPEPVTTAATALAAKAGEAGVEILKEETKGFLKAIFGPVVSDAGEWLTSSLPFKRWRYENLVDTVGRAQQKCKDAGIDPKTVPFKILHPLLENASVEAERELRDRWANLLANEADPKNTGSRGVAFVAILKEMGTREARFLDAFMEFLDGQKDREWRHAPTGGGITVRTEQKAIQIVQAGLHGFTNDELYKVHEIAGLSEVNLLTTIVAYYRLMDLFERNGIFSSILSPLPHGFTSADESSSKLGIEAHQTYRLTNFGSAFLSACRAPGTKSWWMVSGS